MDIKMDRKAKTAVVGCGMISNIYLKNLKNLFHIIDLVAVGNRSMASAEEPAFRFEMKPLAPGCYSSFMGGAGRADAEKSLVD